MNLLKINLLGSIDGGFFFTCVFFAAMGILLVLLMGTTTRNVDSTTSPKQFSWKYLWSDNTKRILASVIATLATLRFMTELTGMPLTEFGAFCIGMGWDGISFFIKQKTSILDPKAKP